MRTEPTNKPEGVLAKMYDTLDPLDPMNWNEEELQRAWNLGRSEAIHEVSATLRRIIRERINESHRKEVDQVLELIKIIENEVK